jgi:hypothetical protein
MPGGAACLMQAMVRNPTVPSVINLQAQMNYFLGETSLPLRKHAAAG